MFESELGSFRRIDFRYAMRSANIEVGFLILSVLASVRHSSRKRPLKLSTKPFCVVFIRRDVVPFDFVLRLRGQDVFDVNSVPLSLPIIRGNP